MGNMQLHYSTFIASLAIFLIHHDAVSVELNDEADTREIRENLRNLLDSINGNDTKQIERYHIILENEAAREKQAFDSMKNEFRSARLRKIQQRQLYGEDSRRDEEGAVLKRDVVKKNYNRTRSLRPLPIDLRDIGYDGSEENFCDVEEILDDFPYFPHHDLRRLRITICRLQQLDRIDRDSMPVFAAYKLCNMIRIRTDYFFEELKKKLTDNDEEKESELTAEDKNVDTVCYNETMKAFTKKCMGPQHVCGKMLKDLLNRACVMPWLTAEAITTRINEVCDGHWLTDDVNWDAIIYSIRYFD